METFNKQKWEDLNLSRDEIKSIGQALKKEEFRTLLAEYVKEISDPNNRRQYEEEITQLENERGVDVKFIHPTSGYVIKTSVDGKTKAFINICTNNNVGVPFSSPSIEGENKGVHWSIPYCLAPPREDLDKKKKLCIVYDFVIHPDTLALSKNNTQFKKLINDTAIEGLEKNFNVSLDKVNLKFPKMQFKGLKHATVIRKRIEGFKQSDCSTTQIPNCPYPTLRDEIEDNLEHPEINKRNPPKARNLGDSKYTAPSYTIKHRSSIEMENFTNDPMCKMAATVPNELVIIIDLPLLKCSSEASVDVTENSLALLSEKTAKYRLDIKLPYPVDRNRGGATFDISKRMLTITLPVIKQEGNSLSNIDLSREDSGVESDNGNGRSDSISSNEEDSENLSVKNTIEMENNISSTVFKNKEEKSNDIVKGFLNPDLHYSLPNYFCKYLNDVLIFTFNVRNVSPESLNHCFLNDCSGFHLTFVSMGAGFFPVNYAVYFMLPPPNKIENSTFKLKIHENNVIAQIKLILPVPDIVPTEYYIGTDQHIANTEVFPTNVIETVTYNKTVNKEVTNIHTNGSDCSINERTSGNKTEYVESKADKRKENNKKNYQNEDEVLNEENNSVEDPDISASTSSFEESTEFAQRKSVKSRTVSESQQGEVMRSKQKGILKIGRSLSESSVDDYASWSAEKNEKTKKTVRFSDVISKQVFRMNSSILGQRKKNQRKTRNKKRALERRLSESGNESEGDDFSGLQGQKHEKIWLNEPESSSCDISEVSDVSDVSESDDGQKENGPPLLPCSSRKNHKRRGKKSARKNAATAKFNYMEY